MSSPRTVLITGANRGIGLGIVKHLLKLPQCPELIFATYRNKDSATELFDIAKKDRVVQPIQLDVKSYSSFSAVAEKVSSTAGSHGLSLLINNAGMLLGRQKLADVTTEQLIETYEVNAVAPVVFTRAFIPLLQTAAKSGHGQEFTWARAAIINITSNVGSISNATEDTMVHYRMSKAALNMFTKCLCNELKEDKILAVAVHPGWVRTDMGGPEANLTTEESVTAIINTLARLNISSNGQFLNYDGTILPY